MQLKFQKRPQTLLNFPRKNPSQTNQGTNIGHVLLKLNKESMPIAPPVKCCYLFRKKHTSSGGIAVSSALYELLKVCEVMSVSLLQEGVCTMSQAESGHYISRVECN